MTPSHPVVATLVDKLDDNLREAFEERAAIFEFEAGIDRQLAECLALLDLINRQPVQVLSYLIR